MKRVAMSLVQFMVGWVITGVAVFAVILVIGLVGNWGSIAPNYIEFSRYTGAICGFYLGAVRGLYWLFEGDCE